MGFSDLHFHLIPGLDDGPPHIATAISLLAMAHQTGTRSVVATPHMFCPRYENRDVLAINDAFARLVNDLRPRWESGEHAFLKELSLDLGAENYLSVEFLDQLASGGVISLGGSRYLLIEFSAFIAPDSVLRGLERVFDAGFVPVLAHVERYPPFVKDRNLLRTLVDRGCIAQLNASALDQRAKRRQRRFARQLLSEGLVHLIASDAHDSRRRVPSLDTASKYLTKKFSSRKAAAWLSTAPRLVLGNADPKSVVEASA
jgi:protein-tyrosine phosphatase